MSVAVVGAGVAGLSAARALTGAGRAVTVFDRGRTPGGRASSRRTDAASFDHGAQYFTARATRFVAEIEALAGVGAVARWRPRIVDLAGGVARPREDRHPRYVGVPDMGALCGALAAGLDVRNGIAVDTLARAGPRWDLAAGGRSLGEFDTVVLAMPPEQALRLVPTDAALRESLAAIRSVPCIALMLEFDRRLPLDYDAAFVRDDAALAWIARDSSKPGRAAGERWVVHAGAAFSRRHATSDPETAAALQAAFHAATGLGPVRPRRTMLHRWGLARVEDAESPGAIVDRQRALCVCGDWSVAPRVEGAWLAGIEAAARLGVPG